MRVHKKCVKKGMAFVMLLALALTMMKPVSSYADELEKGSVSDAGVPEEGSVALEGDTLSSDKVQIPEDAEKTLKQSGDNSSVDEGGQPAAQSSQFESTAPVVEKVDFKQNGTTVKNDSTLSLSLYMYDDSEITDVRVYIRSEESGVRDSMTLSEDKGANANEYILTYQLDGIVTGKLVIDSIVIVDEHSNRTDYNVCDPDTGEYLYWVNAEASASDPIHVKNFSFAKNGQSLETIGELGENDASLETDKAIEDSTVYLLFEKENGESCRLNLSSENYDSSNSLFNHLGGGYANSGKYVLKDVYVKRGVFRTRIPLEMENKEDYSFTVTKDTEWSEDESKLDLASVVIDKNGQQVKQGDEVTITVSVVNKSGESLPETGNLWFHPVAPNIDDVDKDVPLTLGEDQKYHGTLKIEKMYPCEWYVDSVSIGTDYWSEGTFPDKERYPYYVCVYSGEAFVNPSFDVEIRFMALDEDGYYNTAVSEVVKENVERRQTLKEIGVVLPETTSAYEGMKQIGWTDGNGKEITEDTPLFEGGSIWVYAKYDKNLMEVVYTYPDARGNWPYIRQTFLLERGETYGDLLKKTKDFVPDDITKEYSFVGWEYKDSYREDEVIPDGRGYVSLAAKFADVTLVQVDRHYYDQKGRDVYSDETLSVKEGTTVNEVIQTLNAAEPPQSYEGLRFQRWNSETYLDEEGTNAAKNGQYFDVEALYENCLVRYIIWAGTEEMIYCQTAERGETVTALTTFDDLGKIIWMDDMMPAETFVVNEDMTFRGNTVSSITPDDPVTPSKPSDSTSGSGNNTNKPSDSKPGSGDNTDVPSDSKLPDNVITSVVEEVKNSEPGETVKVNMNSKTVVSQEILEAARGKDVSVELEMDGYSWTINGKDIQAMDLKDIDLKVIKNTDNIPSSTVKALAGGNPCMQITLAHEGNFGFKATLNIGVGSEHAGKYGNLYYHDSAGKMVFINAGQINSDGNVSLTFSHASDYLLVMSDQEMSQTNVPGSLMPAGTGQDGQNGQNSQNQNGNVSVNGTNGNVTKSPRTGDNNVISLWILLCAAAMGAVAYTTRKKQA